MKFEALTFAMKEKRQIVRYVVSLCQVGQFWGSLGSCGVFSIDGGFAVMLAVSPTEEQGMLTLGIIIDNRLCFFGAQISFCRWACATRDLCVRHTACGS